MMALLCYLHREHLDLFDLWRFGKELRGVGHQSSGNGTCEMGFTAHVVGKRVEYSKRRRTQTQGEPNGSCSFLIRKRECVLQELCDGGFLSLFCFQTNQ